MEVLSESKNKFSTGKVKTTTIFMSCVELKKNKTACRQFQSYFEILFSFCIFKNLKNREFWVFPCKIRREIGNFWTKSMY